MADPVKLAPRLTVVGDYARRVRFWPAYDCIEVQPCTHGSPTCVPHTDGCHGRHGVEAHFDLVGPTGAVTFTIFTGWYLDATPRRVLSSVAGGKDAGVQFHYPEPPVWDTDGWCPSGDCDLLPGGKCWRDTGFTLGEEPWRLLREEGEEAMWQHLATLLPDTEETT